MPEIPAQSALSRRGLVKSTAALAAAGGVALAAAAPADAAGPQRAAAPADRPAVRPEAGSATSFTVYVRDAATGDLDVYHGRNHIAVRDRALAAQLARLAR